VRHDRRPRASLPSANSSANTIPDQPHGSGGFKTNDSLGYSLIRRVWRPGEHLTMGTRKWRSGNHGRVKSPYIDSLPTRLSRSRVTFTIDE
jgi:hypothetical protein